jgi:hypothetical protein
MTCAPEMVWTSFRNFSYARWKPQGLEDAKDASPSRPKKGPDAAGERKNVQTHA